MNHLTFVRAYSRGVHCHPYPQVSRENADFVCKIASLEAETTSYHQQVQSLQAKLETASSELASQIIASSRQQETWELRSAAMQLEIDTTQAFAEQVYVIGFDASALILCD
jgi:hypothetical protein